MIYTVTFNPAIDYVVRLDAPLEVGQVNRACGEDCVLGGKGINVSGVLAQLGCPSVALGFVAGETGAWLERGLAAQGLHTDFVHLENGMTRINVKIKAAQETELNGAGPDIPDEALQELEEKLDSLTENDVLILAGSIPASLPQDVYERLLARLDGRGVRCVVDATRALLVNVLPFLILMICVFPLTRVIVGTTVGTKATIVPLVVAAFPFVARLVETSLRELDEGVVEAAQSMGATPFQIITKVMIPECLPGLISSMTTALTTILGYSAMSGVLGGGGLGKIALSYGYYRYQTDIMIVCVILLVLMVQVFQSAGTFWATRSDKRLRK